MEKLKMHSLNLTDENIAKIREILPDCVTEAKDENGQVRYAVDFDQLRQQLSDHVVDGPRERYQLDWPGKSKALLAANTPIAKTLRPCREESVDFDATQNLFIEGDNLEALKLLQETYLGGVKVVYIDPPYNTGKDFVYKDSFTVGVKDFEKLAKIRNDEGGRLVANPETRGRYHSDWLTMLYPRLILAHRLLSNHGVILVSIDDNEQASLRKILDQIFGEQNFVAQLVWEKGRKNDAKFFSIGHEYMLVYAKNVGLLRQSKETWREEKPGAREIWEEFVRLREMYGDNYQAIESKLKNWFSDLPKNHPSKKWSRYKRADENGPWRDRDISWPGGDGPRYDVIHPVTKKPCKVPERGWIYSSPDEMKRQIKLGLVEFRGDHTEPPFRKAHIRPVVDAAEEIDIEDDNADIDDTEFATQVRGSYFYKQSQVSVKYLRNLMGAKVFTNPKDHIELARLIQYVTPTENSSIVMDFFAGSASTAEAVFELNSANGTNHKFILVQLPEDLEDMESSSAGAARKAVKAAIKLLKAKDRPLLLTEIAKERIRRAGAQSLKGICHGNWIKDVGFRVLKVDSSNMADVYYTPVELKQDDLLGAIDNIKPDRGDPEDLLFQVLVDWGVNLTLPIRSESIQGKTVFFVNEAPYDLMACFDTGITEELVKALAKHKPMRMVFRDNGFVSDAVKINVDQVFRQLSPATEVKSI